MSIGIDFSSDYKGKIVRKKGNSVLSMLDEFTVIDIETIGFVSTYDEILEIGAIKYRYNNIIDKFHSYVALESKKLYLKDDNYPLNIHGNITIGMLRNAPDVQDILKDLFNFIQNDTLVAHNANFDINFIYDKANKYLDVDFNNDFVDTLRLARRLFPDLENHKLSTLCEEFQLCKPDHRSLADCYTTLEFYNICKNKCIEENKLFENYKTNSPKNLHSNIIYKKSVANFNNIMDHEVLKKDESNSLAGKTVVFTGTLENLIRKDALQLVVNLGGDVSDTVNKSTNYLVMGLQDYSKFTDGKESTKTKKAKQLINLGQDLQIIDENDFIRMII